MDSVDRSVTFSKRSPLHESRQSDLQVVPFSTVHRTVVSVCWLRLLQFTRGRRCSVSLLSVCSSLTENQTVGLSCSLTLPWRRCLALFSSSIWRTCYHHHQSQLKKWTPIFESSRKSKMV